MGDIVDKLLGIQKIWHTYLGLIAAESFAIASFTLFLKQIEIPFWGIGIAALVTAIIILGIWLYSRSYPKTKKNKIGFVVSISCEDDQSHNKIRDDFVITLRKLVTAGNSGKHFQFIEIPRHISSTIIDYDNAKKLIKNTKAHFALYGRCRTRQINSSDHNFIELDGVVAHGPIPKPIKDQLSSEFTELLPRKLAICKENDIFAFELTSEWTDLVAKYIIAIASAISGDLNYAELLFNEVRVKLSNSKNNIPAYIKLKERLPVRLAEIYEAKAAYCFNKWFSTRDELLIDQLNHEISKIELKNISINANYFKAIGQFLKNRDVNTSIKTVKSCPKSNRDAVWHLNLAFLEAYKGNLNKSLQHYRNSIKFNLSVETLSQIEGFISNILEIEPDKVQLYFCLGYINWKIKGDNIRAIKDYSQFIELADNTTFCEQLHFARKWVEEIKETINYIPES